MALVNENINQNAKRSAIAMTCRYAFVAGFLLLSASASLLGEQAEASVDFDRDIAPLLAKKCLDCHNKTEYKAELDLSRSESALSRSAVVIVPFELEASLLWKKVFDEEMPPENPLSPREKDLFRNWIASGARWGKSDPIDRFAYSTDHRAGTDWWSLQPIARPTLPQVKNIAWIHNPIDAFILARLESENIKPAPPADPGTLIRRVYFDLIGLPPTPSEIEAFVNDSSQEAYANLIDRLLASKHYGERWARHWLDVARYTESQGFEYDRFRPNAWHYRDYVINAFNDDKPYDVFLQEQIAGDVVNFASPEELITPESKIATSLLVCGPWDQAGNSQANVTQKKITREEELEDLISVVGQTFLGMTVNCARCHSHKFDPIPQEDYYRFKSVFEGVKHGESSIASDADELERKQNLADAERSYSKATASLRKMELAARIAAAQELENSSLNLGRSLSIGPEPFARWVFDGDSNDAVGSLHGQLVGGASIRDGCLELNGENQFMFATPIDQSFTEKTLEAWVAITSIDQRGGGLITLESKNGKQFDSIVFGEQKPRLWTAGSEGFIRTKQLLAEPEVSASNAFVHLAITYRNDNTIAAYRNGIAYGEPYLASSLQEFSSNNGRVLIGLRHTGAKNGFLAAKVASASLYQHPLNQEEIAASFAAGIDGGTLISREQMRMAMTIEQREEFDRTTEQIGKLRNDIDRHLKSKVSYFGTRVQPDPTHRLDRGNVTEPSEVVSPAGLSSIKTPSSNFNLAPDAPESDRRVHLARWLADPRHPLVARVIVNRLWHYHFGRGIVETPTTLASMARVPRILNCSIG